MSPCPTISVASRDGGDKTDLAELDADWRGESERNGQTVFPSARGSSSFNRHDATLRTRRAMARGKLLLQAFLMRAVWNQFPEFALNSRFYDDGSDPSFSQTEINSDLIQLVVILNASRLRGRNIDRSGKAI